MYGRDAAENIENISYYTKGWEYTHRTIDTSWGEHTRFSSIQHIQYIFLCASKFLTPGILMLWDIWMNCCRLFRICALCVFSIVYITFSQPAVTVSFAVRVKNYAITNSSLFVQICAKEVHIWNLVLYHFNWVSHDCAVYTQRDIQTNDDLILYKNGKR